MASLSIKDTHYNIEVNWKDWAITIKAERYILDKISGLFGYLGTGLLTNTAQTQRALFYQPRGQINKKQTHAQDEESIAMCAMQ